MKEEFLTEEKYHSANEKVKKVGKVLIIVGLTLLILGIVFTICGFLGFGISGYNSVQGDTSPVGIFSGMGLFVVGGFLIGPGGMLTFIGLILRFLIGNRREIVAYTTQQVMPVAQEGIEKMAPTIGNAAKEITKGIKEGLSSGKK